MRLARNAGARLVQRQFDNWASHQNWGLRNINFKYPWVFYIDADERLTPKAINSYLKCPLLLTCQMLRLEFVAAIFFLVNICVMCKHRLGIFDFLGPSSLNMNVYQSVTNVNGSVGIRWP